MKVLQKATMPDGTNIQIEDWSEDYSVYTFGTTLASYPISKMNMDGQFSPKLNRKFRCAFEFATHEDTNNAYNELITGNKVLTDYVEFLRDKKDIQCI